MKKALDILVKEGLIIRRRGSGTFVKAMESPNIFTGGLSQRYKGIKEVESEVIVFEVILSDKIISDKLHKKFYLSVYRRNIKIKNTKCT